MFQRSVRAFGVQDAHAAVLTNEGQALTIGRVDPGLCPGLPTPLHRPFAERRNEMRLVNLHQVEVGGHNRKASRRAPARLVGAHPVPFNGGCRGVTELGGLVAPDSRVLSALSRRRGCWRSWLGFWRSVSCLVTGQGSCSSKQGPIAHALLHSRKNESRNDHHVFSKDPL